MLKWVGTCYNMLQKMFMIQENINTIKNDNTHKTTLQAVVTIF